MNTLAPSIAAHFSVVRRDAVHHQQSNSCCQPLAPLQTMVCLQPTEHPQPTAHFSSSFNSRPLEELAWQPNQDSLKATIAEKSLNTEGAIDVETTEGISTNHSVKKPSTSSALPPTTVEPDPAEIAVTSAEIRTAPSISKINACQVHNRILALMTHTTRYAFKGESRLAADAGVSKSAVSRLVNGQSTPSYPLVVAITRALEQQLKRPLDPRDIVSVDGTYPTSSACTLAGCKGCLPDEAYDEQNNLKPQYRTIQPGQWSLPSSKAPLASPASGLPSSDELDSTKGAA
jgi:transcriptional regulator with XRE-family HTH domain